MPDAEPYRAWQTFTFTADQRPRPRGRPASSRPPAACSSSRSRSTPARPPTTARPGCSATATRPGRSRTRCTSPTRRPRSSSPSCRGRPGSSTSGNRFPRIEAAVFLSAENLQSAPRRVPAPARLRPRRPRRAAPAWTASGPASSTSRRPASATASRRPSPSSSRSSCRRSASPACTGSAGSAPTSSSEKSFDTGPTWEDYLATNPSLPTDYPRRVRVYLTERTATDDDRKSVQRAAHREYLALQGISHDGIVRAEQYSDELLAGPAVVFRHGANWQRLDHFISGSPDLPLDTRLEMIRQLAEALDHAHRRHLYHRALAPRSVYVELDGRYPRLRIADWQVAARPHGTTGGTAAHQPRRRAPRSAAAPPRSLAHIERSAGPYLAPEFAAPELARAARRLRPRRAQLPDPHRPAPGRDPRRAGDQAHRRPAPCSRPRSSTRSAPPWTPWSATRPSSPRPTAPSPSASSSASLDKIEEELPPRNPTRSRTR